MNDNEIPIPTMPDVSLGDTDRSDETDPGLREELISLAEAGDIKYTLKHIRKASQTVLERIKSDYIRKQTDEANEFISDNLISKFSELMSSLEMTSESDGLEKELQDNKLLKRDLKNIIGYITRYIPLVGLLCGGVIIGKHVLKFGLSKYADADDKRSDRDAS